MLEQQPGIGMRTMREIKLLPPTRLLCPAEALVAPDYSCLDIEKYFTRQQTYSPQNYSTECSEKRSVNIISSYGCPYNCFFCANRSLTRSHIVYRPVADVLNEIDFFVKKFRVKQISFMDDNIVADRKRAKELLSALISRNYNLEIQIGNLAAWDLDDEILDLLQDVPASAFLLSPVYSES